MAATAEMVEEEEETAEKGGGCHTEQRRRLSFRPARINDDSTTRRAWESLRAEATSEPARPAASMLTTRDASATPPLRSDTARRTAVRRSAATAARVFVALLLACKGRQMHRKAVQGGVSTTRGPRAVAGRSGWRRTACVRRAGPGNPRSCEGGCRSVSENEVSTCPGTGEKPSVSETPQKWPILLNPKTQKP